MTRALADTSVFIARESGRPLERARVPRELAVSVITYAELRAGVLVAADLEARTRRLATLDALADLAVVHIDATVADAWSTLRAKLRDSGRSMKVNASWIAATALALGVPVITQDGDFDMVPDLSIIRV